jgi:redox-sensitive bicupin YhaK (pirin superfamily)
MKPAAYRDLQPADIPTVALEGGVSARVVAGRILDVEGPIRGHSTAPVFVEVVVPQGATTQIPIPVGHEGFVYPFEGGIVVGDDARKQALVRGELAVLGAGDHVRLSSPNGPARALVVAGKPLHEPIVQHGPFVMNTAEEIEQAIRDFRSGRF